MDLHKINRDKEINVAKEFDFLFLGHLRDSKGVDILIKAWKLLNIKHPEAKLLLAGNLPDGSKLDLTDLCKYNVFLNITYLSDNDYFFLLKKARNVVLPYKSGTNSGVLYNLITMDVNIIYSDLLMFTSNPLLNKKGKFLVNDTQSLFQKMCEFYVLKDVKMEKNTEEYMSDFSNKVYAVYKDLLDIKK